MFFLYVLELVSIVLFGTFMITQVVVPLLLGKQTFPYWHRRKLEAKLAHLAEEATKQTLAERARDLGKELNQRRQPTNVEQE